MTFAGIPHAATDFYARLEADNSRTFWETNAQHYERDVRAPLTALLAGLEEEFGPATVFRPQRDVRFSADKSPYKTHQGGYVGVATRTGWYVEVSADGFRLGAGCYFMDAATLAAYRSAVDGRRGADLERIVERLSADGWEIGGEQLRTAPRGVSRDHPRIELMRRKALTAMRWIEDGDVVTGPGLLDRVRTDWRSLRPLVTWLAQVVPAASGGRR